MTERPKEIEWFKGERVLLRRLVNRRRRLMAAITGDTFITNKNLYSILLLAPEINLYFVLGLLNSKLISFIYINQVSQAVKDDFPQVTIRDILALPFPDKSKTGAVHDLLAGLVVKMVKLNREMEEEWLDHKKTAIQRQIEYLDRQIDELVYNLYGLGSEEVKIVEGKWDPQAGA